MSQLKSICASASQYIFINFSSYLSNKFVTVPALRRVYARSARNKNQTDFPLPKTQNKIKQTNLSHRINIKATIFSDDVFRDKPILMGSMIIVILNEKQ